MYRLAILAVLACSGCGVVTYTATREAHVKIGPTLIQSFADGVERCRVQGPVKVEVQK